MNNGGDRKLYLDLLKKNVREGVIVNKRKQKISKRYLV